MKHCLDELTQIDCTEKKQENVSKTYIFAKLKKKQRTRTKTQRKNKRKKILTKYFRKVFAGWESVEKWSKAFLYYTMSYYGDRNVF